jgi:hypothetical protein
MKRRTLNRRAVRLEANILVALAIRTMVHEGAVNRDGWTHDDGMAVEERMLEMADVIEMRSSWPQG